MTPISIELFATVGLGLESLAKSELGIKFGIIPEDPELTGKTFFCFPQERVKELVRGMKSIERLFAVVLKRKFSQLDEVNHELNYDDNRVPARHCNWKIWKRGILSPLYLTISNYGKLSSMLNSIQETIKQVLESNESPSRLEPTKDNDEDIPQKRPREPITFRVSVKLSTKYSRFVSENEVAKCVGAVVMKKMSSFGWTISLRRPLLDINVYLTNDWVLLGISLTSVPLSDRAYLRHIPMRSTVAYAMGHLLQSSIANSEGNLNSHECVRLICDPMCGAGTILIELLKENPGKFEAFGFDICPEQLAKAKENLAKSGLESQVSLIQCDVTNEMWKNAGVFDALLCDIPFGMKHKLVELKKLLMTFDSLVKNYSFVILLLENSLCSSLAADVVGFGLKWAAVNKFPVRLGLLESTIFVFKKND